MFILLTEINKMKTNIFFVLMLCLYILGNAQPIPTDSLYFGQTPPGDSAIIFAPGIISTDYTEHCTPEFSKDGNEVYWWVCMVPGNNSQLTNPGMTMKRIDNRWTSPAESSFRGKVSFSVDGERLFFTRNGSYPDYPSNGYYVEKKDSGWGEPMDLGIVSRFPELKAVSCISVTQQGTLYFSGDTVGKLRHVDMRIYRSQLVNGEYVKPELLPTSINLSPFNNGTPFIAPDESYLIFSSNRSGGTGKLDLYISFRIPEMDSWSEPINMGNTINSTKDERYAGLSPDGEYLFFTRLVAPRFNYDVFWISTSIIDKLNQIAFAIPEDSLYFGQTPPGDIAEIFAPGIISKPERIEMGLTFSPDGKECYFVTSEGSGTCIYYTKNENKGWTEQVKAPFSSNNVTSDPFFSLDGEGMYFNVNSSDWSERNIYYVERVDDGWGNPNKLLSPINSTSKEQTYYASSDGVAYIQSNRGNDNWDIWEIKYLPDQTANAVMLDANINSTSMELSPCIAPDGSYLIFSSDRSGSISIQDLYISFKKADSTWTKPVNMEEVGANINIPGYNQINPSISPDGEYLFYSNHSHSRNPEFGTPF